MADNEQLILSISADTRAMQRQLDKLVGQIGTVDNSLGDAFTKAPPKIDNVAKSLGKTRFETANLAAQFQDIAVQLQGGGSPLTVALQQGTQISQVLGQRGAAGAVGLLGAAFTSLLNPVSLATIGIIALGGYAVKYATKAAGGVDDLDDRLKANAELVKALKDAYGELGKGVDTAMHESAAVLQAFTQLSTETMKRDFANLALSVAASMSDVIAVTDSVGGSTVIEEASGKYRVFKSVIDEFRASVKEGRPDVLAFRKGLTEIAETTTDEKVRKIASELKNATDAAAKFQIGIESNEKALRNFDPAVLAASESAEKFVKAMKALDASVMPDLSPREKIMRDYTEALVAAGGTEERLAAARSKDAKLAILADNERKKAAEENAKSAESNAKRFESSLASISKRTAEVGAATAALGMGAMALSNIIEEVRP